MKTLEKKNSSEKGYGVLLEKKTKKTGVFIFKKKKTEKIKNLLLIRNL